MFLLLLGPNPILSTSTSTQTSCAIKTQRCMSSNEDDTATFATKHIATTRTISPDDNRYMKQAIDAASRGVGNTFPNPAVGCVLVSKNKDQGEDEVLGVGFHPKAGYPHAEVFALFEACGYVDSGVDSAQAVVQHTKAKSRYNPAGNSYGSGEEVETPDVSKVDELLEKYSSDGGAEELFKDKFVDDDVTAYVTLDPCCHFGKTPPCAMSFLQAGVNRVVVGFRDPNPRVDGGGVTMMAREGIPVDLMMKDASEAESDEEAENAQACADIVSAFAKRITPRDESTGKEMADYDSYTNGAKRSKLRSIAGRKKMDGNMKEFHWPTSSPSVDAKDKSIELEEAIGELVIDHGWMETADGALWDDEMILLRLNNAVQKKKGVKILGQRIAKELGAHVAQVVGHTALLYRPGSPPVLNLSEDGLTDER